MELRLALPYKLKPGEGFQFLEPHETDAINGQVVTALNTLPPTASQEQRTLLARETRKKYIEDGKIDFTPRVTAFLLRTAIELRYRKDAGNGQFRVEIPRKAENKMKPGIWWGEIQEQMDEFPRTLGVSALQAAWLLGVWDDEKVQNNFPPNVQSWLNIMETGMSLLRTEVDTVVEEKK